MNFSVISPKAAPSFNGTFLIPFDQIKNKGAQSSQTMRDIGRETAKFADMKDMMQTNEGMVVKIDDRKDAEYQAVIAKYGVAVKKVNTPVANNSNPQLNSYRFMQSKLNPNDVDKKINEYMKMDQNTQNKEYLKVYNEFKNSPYSVENIYIKSN